MVPSFILWVVPSLACGYIAFLWSGYALGKWVHQAEIAGLKSANEASKAQNDVLKTQIDAEKSRATVLDERLKFAKDQADDALKKTQELKIEVADIKTKLDSNAPPVEVAAAFSHADIKASNLISANNAISSLLWQPIVSSRHTRIDVISGEDE